MGRRAKNKQAPPEPLDKKEYTSPKKLGKRKAEDLDDKPRPAKKSKDSVSAKSKSKSKPSKTGPRVKFGDDDANSSDGWEDVQDEGVMCVKQKKLCRKALVNGYGSAVETWTAF
ncbi:hypothetical protein K438DRAFT_1239349 [Mycena galopus ATCC 62051]|nr:hypothetical protein K438DRAFT_1239349 [Mycena galopus ATCC 62051]